MAIFPTGSGEATIPENLEDLNASVWSGGTEEYYGIHFPDCKVVDEYRGPVDPK